MSATTNHVTDNLKKSLSADQVLHIQSSVALNQQQKTNIFLVPNHSKELFKRATDGNVQMGTKDFKAVKEYIYLMDVNPDIVILDSEIVQLIMKYNPDLKIIVATISLVERHSFLRTCTHWFVDETSILVNSAFLALKSAGNYQPTHTCRGSQTKDAIHYDQNGKHTSIRIPIRSSSCNIPRTRTKLKPYGIVPQQPSNNKSNLRWILQWNSHKWTK